MMNRRGQALISGHKTYEAEQPCRKGHSPAKRYTSNGMCVACLSERYKRQQNPLANVVYVPPEMQATFDALITSMGLRTEARPGARVEPLAYTTDTPGVPSAGLQAAHMEALDSPEQRAYDARYSALMITRGSEMPPAGRVLYDAMAQERDAVGKMRERVAVKHGVAIEELLHTFF